ALPSVAVSVAASVPLPSGSAALAAVCQASGDVSLPALAAQLQSATTSGRLDPATQQLAGRVAGALGSISGLTGPAEQARTAAVTALGNIANGSADATSITAAASAAEAARNAVCTS
ncbi:MAG TPA: hypothetical protein VGK63_00515, partial [Candidatus Limnocylindrales bacterium]